MRRWGVRQICGSGPKPLTLRSGHLLRPRLEGWARLAGRSLIQMMNGAALAAVTDPNHHRSTLLSSSDSSPSTAVPRRMPHPDSQRYRNTSIGLDAVSSYNRGTPRPDVEPTGLRDCRYGRRSTNHQHIAERIPRAPFSPRAALSCEHIAKIALTLRDAAWKDGRSSGGAGARLPSGGTTIARSPMESAFWKFPHKFVVHPRRCRAIYRLDCSSAFVGNDRLSLPTCFDVQPAGSAVAVHAPHLLFIDHRGGRDAHASRLRRQFRRIGHCRRRWKHVVARPLARPEPSSNVGRKLGTFCACRGGVRRRVRPDAARRRPNRSHHLRIGGPSLLRCIWSARQRLCRRAHPGAHGPARRWGDRDAHRVCDFLRARGRDYRPVRRGSAGGRQRLWSEWL